jgi:hypothetical protein
MGVFNRRNAAVGWLALLVGKRVLKKKAKSAKNAVESVRGEGKKPGKGLALLAAGALGAVTFWKKRSGGGDDDDSGSDDSGSSAV